MPVVVVAPNGRIVDKLRSNLEEVKARAGGFNFLICSGLADNGEETIYLPSTSRMLAPIASAVPLSFLPTMSQFLGL